MNRTIETRPDKPMISEVFVLRSLACLSLVLLHAVNRIVTESGLWIDLFKLMLTFGTPTFVFISELILSYTYRDNLPHTFWAKRFRYLLMPYLCFGALYAAMKAADVALSGGGSWAAAFGGFVWRHLLLGDYHGYFILIIFQFYVLHAVFNRYVRDRYPAGSVIGLSLLVNLSYLAFFNFVSPLDIPFADYIWSKMYWLPFPGWLAYFALAYCIGRRYELFIGALKRHGVLIFSFLVLTALGLHTMYAGDILGYISSKRIDMVFFAIAMMMAMLWTTSRLKRPPQFLVRISQYSFGIYLIHPLFTAVLFKAMGFMPFDIPPLTAIGVLFIGSAAGSVAVTAIMQKFKFGPYIVGKIGAGVSTSGKNGPLPAVAPAGTGR